MSEKQMVDDEFAEWEQDKEATYILTNLVEELNEPDSLAYFWEKLSPFTSELFANDGAQMVQEVLFQWIRVGGQVASEHFKQYSDWVAENIASMDEFGRVHQCLQMAILYSPKGNYFSPDEKENARFADTNMIEQWVDTAMEHASSVDDWNYIIEVIAQPDSGSNLADKAWGARILEKGMSALDAGEGKKLEARAKDYL